MATLYNKRVVHTYGSGSSISISLYYSKSRSGTTQNYSFSGTMYITPPSGGSSSFGYSIKVSITLADAYGSGNLLTWTPGSFSSEKSKDISDWSYGVPNKTSGTTKCVTTITLSNGYTYNLEDYLPIDDYAYWNDINAWNPGRTSQNGLIFDLTTSDGGSWINITNEPDRQYFTKLPGTSATISNIRSNVTGAHYSGTSEADGTPQTITWIFNTADKAINLYTDWDTYAVTYNANGGVGAPAQQTKTYGVDLTLSSTVPTMSSTQLPGYTVYFNANGGTCNVSSYTTTNYLMYGFEEWNSSQDGTGTTYYPSGTYTQNAILRLYAQWNAHTERGGVPLPTPTKTGCNFLGWSRSLIDIQYVQDGYIPEADETLYAIYQQSEKIYTTSTLLDGLVIQSASPSNITPFSFTMTAIASLPIVRDITYSFSKDGGSTWTPYQVSNSYTFTNLEEETTYLVMVRAKAIHQGIHAQDDIAYTANAISVTTPADQARIWIKVNGVWVKGKAFIKVNGEWKKAKKVYIKKDGEWVPNKND